MPCTRARVPQLMMIAAAIAAATIIAGCVSPGRPGPSLGGGAITAAELRRVLYDFAADSFRGRAPGTPDARRAARFLAERLTKLGLEPAGDSGFFQRVPLARQSLDASTFELSTPDGTTRIPVGEALVPIVSLGAALPAPRTEAEGDVVFAGYGAPIPSLERNDLARVDVAGKVVVVVNDAPDRADSAERARLSSREAITMRLRAVLVRRPAAVIVLLTGAAADSLRSLLPGLLHAIVARRLTPDATADSLRPPMILLGVLRPGSPLLPAGWPEDDRPQQLAGRRFLGHVVVTAEPLTAYNVAGIVRGSDPALARSYVAYGAHLDHIGIQPPVGGDSIANGADDDGSGSVALLALARRFITMPRRPARSILLVWHTGEEEGMLGSAWFASHPTVPIDSIVAELNADMIGRNAPDSLYVVGPRASPRGRSRVLGEIMDSVNATLPRPFVFDRGWDSASDPSRAYDRSDQASYARRGIPVLFVTSGLHPDYHAVTDEAPRIDYDKLARVTELLYRTGVAAAERRTHPR